MQFFFKIIFYKLFYLEVNVVKGLGIGLNKKLKRFSFWKKITVLIIWNINIIINIGGEANGDF